MKLLHPAMLPAALRRQLMAARPGLIQAVQERWYLAAGICLILTSAGLRFHGLTEHGLRNDEWWVSHFTDGSLAELVSGMDSRIFKAPILYPLLLWVVQKIDVSLFSIRFLPAAAGVLTTASLLFLLPQAGLNRRAAFLAALGATFCAQLVWHSQDAREYAIDALMATLMVAGLLWYLRDNRKLPLGLSLFFAVQLQWGLVLLGASVLAVAWIHRRRFRPPAVPSGGGPRLLAGFKTATGPLVWPAALFLAGCALSYAINPIPLGKGVETPVAMEYLEREFLGTGYSVGQAIGFAVRQTWQTLIYLLPPPAALGVLGGLALFLLARSARWVMARRQAKSAAARGEVRRNAPEGRAAGENGVDFERLGSQAVITLFLLSITIGAASAVLNLYPFGYTRHSIYLGPGVFLAAGVLIHWAISNVSGFFRRKDWASAALFLAAGALLLAIGAVDLQQRDRQYGHGRTTSYAIIVPFLQENVLADDVFVSYDHLFWMLDWYSAELTDSYYRGPHCLAADHPPTAGLMRCIRYAASIGAAPPNRLWFVAAHHFPAHREFAKWSGQTLVQPVITQLTGPQLHLITNLEAGWSERYQAITAGEPAARSAFEVYLDDDELRYAKEPCAPSDTADTFLLHLVPADVGDLPEWRRGYDTDNLDFQFDETYFDREVYAARFDGKCLASVPLPDYPIVEIRTGQLRPDGSALWQVDFVPNPEVVQQAQERRRRDYRAVVSGPPAARAVFAMYLDGGMLHYAKEPCGPADTEATFLLHLIPQDADDLPEGNSRFYGFENRDFTFTDHGAEFDGKCLASVPLPDYPIAVIRTGQYRPDGQRLWTAEFPAGR